MLDISYLCRRALVIPIILVMAAFLLAAPARAQDPDVGRPIELTPVSPEFPAELAPPPRVEFMQAKRLLDGGQPAEAAALLEALARETGDVRLLYHAAIARGRAGQNMLALRHLTAVRGLPGLGQTALADIDAKLAAATAQLIVVRLDIREPIASRPAVALVPGTRITVEAAGVPAFPAPPTATLRLDPGPWIVRVDVPGYAPLVAPQQVVAGPGDRVWQLLLTRRMVAQELRFAPPRALRRAKLRLVATDRQDLAPIVRAIDGPRTTVQLTTGTWQLLASSPRHQATSTLVVGPDPRPVDIVLLPRTAADSPRFIKERKLVVGVSVVMGVAFYSGIGLSLGGANREGKVREKNAELLTAAGVPQDAEPDPAALAELEAAYPTASAHRDLRRAVNLQFAGTTVMTGGLGMLVGVLPSLFEARRRAAYIELGIGAAATLGGSLWTYDYVRRRDQRLGATDPDQRVDSSGLAGHRVGASMITGMGIGMTVGSALLLITDHVRRRKRNTVLHAAPTLTGVLVRGEF